jgi:hypothetical protein
MARAAASVMGNIVTPKLDARVPGIAVWWLDARATEGWKSQAEVDAFSKEDDERVILSYGHVITANEHRLTIAQNRNYRKGECAAWGEILEIPLGMVADVRLIRFSRRRVDPTKIEAP